jgi:5-formyltetrahydrofolate cyclo-ligase
LRRELRARRAACNAAQRARISRHILLQVARQPWLHAGRTIALFVGTAGEIDTAPLRALAHARGCRVYLPRIADYRARRMQMRPDDGSPLQLNRYGIAEPRAAGPLPAGSFDVVFIPMLGFDARLHRLGYGVGYYDRWLAACRHGRTLKVGLAPDFSRIDTLPALPTDVPLDLIVTETGIQR